MLKRTLRLRFPLMLCAFLQTILMTGNKPEAQNVTMKTSQDSDMERCMFNGSEFAQ